MTVHVKSKFYLFRNPFFVSQRARCFPAGNYCVETYEQIVQGEQFQTYQPVLTLLHVNAATGSSQSDQMIPVDPEELELVFIMDQDQTETVGWEGDLSEQEERLIVEICRTQRPVSKKSPFASLVH